VFHLEHNTLGGMTGRVDALRRRMFMQGGSIRSSVEVEIGTPAPV
jgi:hypothetical protein